MRFKFLFGMVMFSLLFYGCKSKVTKWLDKLEAEISRVEDLCEKVSDGNMSGEKFIEELKVFLDRANVLFEEGHRLADYDITEGESLRLTQIMSRYDNIVDAFSSAKESNNDSYSEKDSNNDDWWNNDYYDNDDDEYIYDDSENYDGSKG